jgi:hypothetical protein
MKFTIVIIIAVIVALIAVFPFWAQFVEKVFDLEMWSFLWWLTFIGVPLAAICAVICAGLVWSGLSRLSELAGTLLLGGLAIVWPVIPVGLYLTGMHKGVEVPILEEGGNLLCGCGIAVVWPIGIYMVYEALKDYSSKRRYRQRQV